MYSGYNMIENNWWVHLTDALFNYTLYCDGLSLFFFVLTVFLVTLILFLGPFSVKFRLREYFFYFVLLQLFILNFFFISNLFYFYIYFESVLMPMFLIILIWGSRKRKIHASFIFFFFTFIGSLFMLLGICWFILNINNINILYLRDYLHVFSVSELFLWFLFFVAFAVKVPIFPFHTWLPEAHVEAPTGGSIILAGILLKLGLYGLLRVVFPLLPTGSQVFSPVVWVLSFISVIYISLIIMQNIDLKKIIAYSSIAHMNFAILGLFVFNNYGLQGAIFTLLSHGIISSMLFFCIGILYDRYGERNLLYYTNISQLMPLFSLIFFFAMIGNMGIPGMSSFIGEFLLLLSLSYKSYLLMFILSLSLFLTTIYCIWLYNRLSFGFIKIKFIRKFKDLTRLEFLIGIIFTLSMIIFGLYPRVILNITSDYTLDLAQFELNKIKYFNLINESYKIILESTISTLPKEWQTNPDVIMSAVYYLDEIVHILLAGPDGYDTDKVWIDGFKSRPDVLSSIKKAWGVVDAQIEEKEALLKIAQEKDGYKK